MVCFSHLRWDFVWQRPQHILSRAARSYDIVFVEEPIFKSGATPHLEIHERAGGIRVAIPVLPDRLGALAIDEAQHVLVQTLLASEPARKRVFWYYTPMAMAFTADLPAELCIYDNMDELSAFRGASPEMLANEADLFRRADLVFTGGRSLYEAKKSRHPSVHLLPSSIEFEHFAAARSKSAVDPSDQANIPHPRLGFYGVIDERMDLSLLRSAAAARPDWNFVVLGPVVKIDPGMLPRAANIHWLGPKSYAELPAYLSGWDVALMPFALNESTRFISPTKTPEYLAAGVPVVSTAIADVVKPYGEDGLVEIARNATEFVAKAGSLLNARNAAWLAKVDEFLARSSWDKTWGRMDDLMKAVLERPYRLAATGALPAATGSGAMSIAPAE